MKFAHSGVKEPNDLAQNIDQASRNQEIDQSSIVLIPNQHPDANEQLDNTSFPGFASFRVCDLHPALRLAGALVGEMTLDTENNRITPEAVITYDSDNEEYNEEEHSGEYNQEPTKTRIR